ncbi:MAG: DNA polymerase III subunit beta, partial [Pseudomonadota bacterium]|nr:DNA polymerase III subunit beta [Pseudomonadota bacterium]
MKFAIERVALLQALSHIQSVVERRNTIPILANVLIKAEAESVSLTATDMDIEIDETVQARIERVGTATVPAHTLYDIVRKLPEGSEV